MKTPNKFFVIVDGIVYLLLILSFVYLFMALVFKYNLFVNVNVDLKFLVPLMGSIATVILAILTFQMIREMKKAREEDQRPYVYVDFIFDSSVIMIMVKNSGRSGAKDVTFSFSPALISSKNKTISEINMFKEGVRFLPPDREIKTWFDMGPSFYKSNLPKAYSVAVKYQSVINNKQYQESFVLDLNTRLGIATIGRHTLHDLVEELKKINKTLTGWGGGRGFLVETTRDRNKRYREDREDQEEMSKENRKEDNKQ